MHECNFCKKSFSRESTLFTHACLKKKRMMAEHEKPNRLAFAFWLKFYAYCTPGAKKAKTYKDFVDSSYYDGFLKFAKHVIDLNPHDVDSFVTFVIKNSLKLSDWCKTWVYETWVKEVNKKETVDRAVERMVLLMQSWGPSVNSDWRNFFVEVNVNQAVQWIRTGRISPWILFGTDAGQTLIGRFNEDHLNLVVDYIEPEYWQFNVSRKAADAKWAQDMFTISGVITHETV